jgi:membrane protease YdiL (CAAX protease family)
MFFGTLVTLYVIAYKEFGSSLFRSRAEELSQMQLARIGISSSIATALSALAFTRKRDWRRLSPAAWLDVPTVVTAAKYFAVLIGVAIINELLVAVLEAVWLRGESIDTSKLDDLRAIRHLYGVPVMMCVAAIAAPIAEEFIFRGVLLDAFSRHLPWQSANFLQAILFASVHDNVKRVPWLIAFGVITGMLRQRTHHLATGMVLHSINNTVALLVIRP